MAGTNFEFNAPTFVDFTKEDYDEVDESYFDLPQKTPRKTQGQPPADDKEQPPTEQGGEQEQIPSVKEPEPLKEQVEGEKTLTGQEEQVEEPEKMPTKQEEQAQQVKMATEQDKRPIEQSEQEHMTTEQTELEQISTEQAKPEKMSTEQEELATKQTEDDEMPSEQPDQEEMATEETEKPELSIEQNEQVEVEQMEVEQEEQEEEEQVATEEEEEEEQPADPKSVSKAKRKKSLMEGAGVRQSPRLLAISRALRRSNARRRSSGDRQAAAATTHTTQLKKIQPMKRVMAKGSGMSITEAAKEELGIVATFRQKMTTNKKRKDGTAPNQPFKPTKPQEFHFATDKRLRKPEVEAAAPAPAPQPAARPTRSGPTKPQEFTFATDKRVKSRESVKEDSEVPMESARSLRSSTLSLNKDAAGRRSPTVPKPFHLSESRKEQGGEAAKMFGSMMELSCKNYIRTPEVFKKTKRTISTDDLEDRKKPRGPTVAVTPNLATSRRRRSLSLMTREERELQELEEARKHSFKARPVNKKALQTPPNGYRVPAKPQVRPSQSLLEEIKMDSPPKKLVSMLPYAGLPLQGKKMNTRVTPFSFDQRDQERLKKKEEKIKKVLEDEKSLSEFHARPMPLFEGNGVPARKPPTPTQVKPFALNVERRGSIKQERFKQQLKSEAQKDAEQRKFQAQDDSVVHKDPFVPQKSNRPLTEISNVTLNTEVRAVERSKFEQQQKELEEEMLATKKMVEEQRAAEEEAEVARLRQAAVHKAQPMPKIKPMVLQPTSQVPTVPQSPDFATDSRLRTRSRTNSTFNL